MSDERRVTSDECPTADPLQGVAYRGSDGAVTCAHCDYECEYEHCGACGGDGFFDGYEEDPLWYDEGDEVPCHECGGTGGHWVCPNNKCETVMITRIHAERPALGTRHSTLVTPDHASRR